MPTSILLIQVSVHPVTWKFLDKLFNSQLENPSRDNSVMLVEPFSNLPDQLYVGHSLSSVCSNLLPIQIMNISPSPVRVCKRMNLGTVIPSTGVLLVSDEDLKTEVQSPSFECLVCQPQKEITYQPFK